MPFIRLDKYITDAGLCSRSQAREWIRRGRVAVNGVTVRDPAERLESGSFTVTLDDMPLGEPGHIYVMLHKAPGILTAARDPRSPTVLDDMPAEWKRRGLFPVGRLDKDTTGLLILTDDGTFAHRVISPKSRVPKLYEAVVDGEPGPEDIAAFREGVELKDGTKCLPAVLEPIGDRRVRVEVFEGKYHQIKRMLGSRRLPVKSLHRLRIGELWLDETLAPGEYRLMSEEEVNRICPGYLSK